jgi:hypothetical protein
MAVLGPPEGHAARHSQTAGEYAHALGTDQVSSILLYWHSNGCAWDPLKDLQHANLKLLENMPIVVLVRQWLRLGLLKFMPNAIFKLLDIIPMPWEQIRSSFRTWSRPLSSCWRIYPCLGNRSGQLNFVVLARKWLRLDPLRTCCRSPFSSCCRICPCPGNRSGQLNLFVTGSVG